MPPARSQDFTPRSARLVVSPHTKTPICPAPTHSYQGPYSYPNRLPALPDPSTTEAWYSYHLPELDDFVKPDPPKPKFMTVEAMAALVEEKRRQAQKAEEEYRKKALAAERARQESETKRVEYENVSVCLRWNTFRADIEQAKANLQWLRLMSPLDHAEMMTAMQQMRQAEGEWMDSLPRQDSHWPSVSSAEDDALEMVRYIRKRWVRVEDEGVGLNNGGWTQVEEQVETTKEEMIRYFEANHQQSS
jgi:hypothetical protein